MKYCRLWLILLWALPLAAAQTPFQWSLERTGSLLKLRCQVAAHHYLYKSGTVLALRDAGGNQIKPIGVAKSIDHEDQFSGPVQVYGSGSHLWVFALRSKFPYTLQISYYGCRDASGDIPVQCLMPQKQSFEISENSIRELNPAQKSAGISKKNPLLEKLAPFKVIGTAGGYLEPERFMAFLEQPQNPEAKEDSETSSFWWLMLLALAGGLALNLTPCVLPMIPVNLAIIGASSASSSKNHGFWLGMAYAAGIMLTYGVLGLLAALGSLVFGQLNSTVWFNAAIAGLFVALAVAMLGVFNLDFSKYSENLKFQSGKFISIFLMGAVASLLAGACVAPVVISMLLLTAKLYAEGKVFALLLPFLLGLGMALPWPLAGAGISALPKPGSWMNKVKMVFALIILLAGAYYGYVAIDIYRNNNGLAQKSGTDLVQALETSRKTGKKLLIDFWATWCKNCRRMDAVTFKDKEVAAQLAEDFIVLKFQAEDPDSEPAKSLMKHFKLLGLPSFVILKPPPAE